MVSVIHRDIVQLVERWSPKPNVEGSSPSAPVIKVCSSYFGQIFLYINSVFVKKYNLSQL